MVKRAKRWDEAVKIKHVDVYQTAIPFRTTFKHSQSVRRHSESIFVRCELADGTVGYGESLPRDYVTGETWNSCYQILSEQILPLLLDCEFRSQNEVELFCAEIYEFIRSSVPPNFTYYGAACCAAELALLDSFGKYFGQSAFASSSNDDPKYSGVISGSSLMKSITTSWLCRRYRLPAVKLKVGGKNDELLARTCRMVLGNRPSLRIDANMAWDLPEALDMIPRLQQFGIQYVEQPLPVDNISECRALHEQTGALIIADESLRAERDARELIRFQACQVFNLRVSKCGGFFQSLRLGRIAREHGIEIQVGCQVGESALLSAVGLALARRLAPVVFAEGCFGERLLTDDILSDRQTSAAVPFVFGHEGNAPYYAPKAGIGIEIDENRMMQYVRAHRRVERSLQKKTTSKGF